MQAVPLAPPFFPYPAETGSDVMDKKTKNRRTVRTGRDLMVEWMGNGRQERGYLYYTNHEVQLANHPRCSRLNKRH